MEVAWHRDPATVSALYDLAVSSGIIKKRSVDSVTDSGAAVSLGVLATPTAFPEDHFSLACDIQPALNSLIDAVSQNHEFLVTALEK